jgi:hypothetical protein
MKLWQDVTRLKVSNAANGAGVTSGDAKVLALACAGNPLRELLPVLKRWVQDIAGTPKYVEAR